MDQHKGAADVVSGALPAMVEEAMTGLLKPRAYQQEMFEESLRQNIIVVVGIHPCARLRRILVIDFGLSRWIPAVERRRCTHSWCWS